MISVDFDTLLDQADTSARSGDWQETYGILQKASNINPEHPGTLTGLGTCLIQLERQNEAAVCFQKVVELAPESPEAHNNLGVVLALIGQVEAAESAYQTALHLSEDHRPTWKNLAQLYLEQNGRLEEGVQILAALVQANPQDVEALLLLATCYEDGGDIQSATDLYRQTLKYSPDQPFAVAALERLRPVSSVIDITRIAQPEHIQKLAALKSLVTPPNRQTSPTSSIDDFSAITDTKESAIAFYGSDEILDQARLGIPAIQLAQAGHKIIVSHAFKHEHLEDFQIFVFSNPHTSPHLLEVINACKQAGKLIVVDLNADFHRLPKDHPGYSSIGPGNPKSLKSLEQAISKADLLTVITPVLAERYGAFSPQIEVIPNGWSRGNSFWDKPASPRNTINIGIAVNENHRKDINILKKDVIRLIQDTPGTLLVIGGDNKVYKAFGALPEERRLFLPPASQEDFPFLLSHFDILLAPLRDNPFNQAKSDTTLLEAGIRRIPWVASPIPAFKDWEVGGLFAEKREDWHSALKKLIEDTELRKELGEAGRVKAETREATALLEKWQTAFGFVNQ